jgi:septal ring factor EnvC (AmiA/AmiB activator)
MSDERELTDNEALGYLTAMEREVDVWLQAARGLRRLRDVLARGRAAQAGLAGYEDRKAALRADIAALEARQQEVQDARKTLADLQAQVRETKAELAQLRSDIAEIKDKHGLSAVSTPAA